MPESVTAASYRARDGTAHRVLVRRTPEGRWHVLDRGENRAIVVETLTGHDDRLAQAQALARDYAAEQQAYHDGHRPHPPLPPPRRRRSGPAMGGVSTRATPAGTRQPIPNYPPRRAMRILRPQPEPSPRPHPPAASDAAGAGGALLRCRLRLTTGRVFTGALSVARHRALQLGMLHADTAELVELTPGTRPPDGKLELDRRTRPEHYLPGGASGSPVWLHVLLEHAERIVAGDYAERTFEDQVREEAFVGVAPRVRPRGNKDAVAATRFLWIDVDQPGQLPALGRSWPNAPATC